MTAAVTDRLLQGELPPEVSLVELFADPPVALFPEEAEAVAGAGDKRRQEYATVRHCARKALVRLGVGPVPIPPRQDGPAWARRAPRWPEGVVGSMTHCDGYRAAAVARAEAVLALGVDAEPNEPLPAGISDTVMGPEERATAARLSLSHPQVAWERLVFSAKESVFKTWYPLTGRWLDFTECTVRPDPERGTFTGTLGVPGPVVEGVRVNRFSGLWCTSIAEGHLATAVVIPARRH
ncbi:4'-phosphopantetheinyl transferase family protein [Streptomyces violens]|uniref:4'-phosphopantetheinyl transferase family protein n=1 Tax=Streptomyces violens TaxID=66377 RepID=UPI00068A03F3|nr:4'-phosphopantetheinyl transferase superfamily protein [Streptomyces violens]